MTDIERLRPEIEKALKYSLNTHTFEDVVELDCSPPTAKMPKLFSSSRRDGRTRTDVTNDRGLG